MAWIIGAVVLYILLSAFIVMALCVHSSRLSQAEQVQQRWEPQAVRRGERIKGTSHSAVPVK